MIISTGKEFVNLDYFIDYRIHVSDENIGYFIGQDKTGIERNYKIEGCTTKQHGEFLTDDLRVAIEDELHFIDLSIKEKYEYE